MKKNNNNIITDSNTLKELLSEATAPWLKKIVTTLIVSNVSLIITVGWGLITDHFTLKDMVATTSIHSKQIKELDGRTTKVESQQSVDDVRIENLEKRKR